MDDTITQQLRGVWKYRWAAIISAWVIATIGWFVVYELPDDFQASARIHVDTRSLLRPLMQGMTVSPDMQRKLIVTSRTLLSRPNLEKVFRMVEPDSESMKPKEIRGKVSGLMTDIKLDATDASNLFSISYNNSDRVRAINVVESLLALFLEESGNTESPTSALRFIDNQIDIYEKKLTVQENNLKAFKQKNVGLMPSQGGGYYTQLATALDDLNKTKLALREAEHSRDSIRQQITGDEPVILNGDETGDGIDPSSIVNLDIDSRIAELRNRLDTLSLNYTDIHPDIISTKRLITQLQSRKIEEAKQMKFGNFVDVGRNYSPMLQQLNLSLTASQARVAAMRARVEEYTNRYNNLKSKSNSVPEVEASLAQLNRDYRINKKNYEQLLERRESAKISGELGSAAKLMSFKIIDPPTASESPVGPDRESLYSLIFFVAIAAGLAIAFAISQFRPSFHSQGMLRNVTGMPVLGTIPMIQNKKEYSNRRKGLYALSLSLLSLLGVYGVLMVKMA